MALTVSPAEIVLTAEKTGKPGLLAKHPSWERVKCGDIAEIVNGFPFRSNGFNVDRRGTPVVRIRDLLSGATSTFFDGDFDPAFVVSRGDLLVGMDGDFRVARWKGEEALLNQRVCKLVVRDEKLYDGRFLMYVLQGYLKAVQDLTSAVTVKHLSSRTIQEIPLPLPPLAEQHRIVDALEEQFSRLDAAERTLRSSRKRVEVLRKSVFTSLVPERVPADWTATTVGGAGTVELGRARHPDWHNGPEMRPYLRVANVFEDRIDTSSVMEMDFSGIFDKYRLREGDILLNEGQSPHLVGRPAMYRGIPEAVAFTNSLLRFQAGSGVLPEWALMVFRRHLHARRFMREVRITTNIAHLSSKRLKAVEFPVPPPKIQKELVQRCDELLSGVEAMRREVDRAIRRARTLRSVILRKAFSGTLAPQDPADEPAAKLLARIAAEREAVKPVRKAVKRAARPLKTIAAAAATTNVLPAPTPAPATSVQQELFDQ
ncbi:restriction endonuclease subunit S [Streptomyces sp. NPDC001054]